MAARYVFRCGRCRYSVEAWDDGHPYIEDDQKRRHVFYHPGEEAMIRRIVRSMLGREASWPECEAIVLERGGNESDFICRACGKQSKLDKTRDPLACRACGAADVERILDLSGRKCLRCAGTFLPGSCEGIS